MTTRISEVDRPGRAVGAFYKIGGRGRLVQPLHVTVGSPQGAARAAKEKRWLD